MAIFRSVTIRGAIIAGAATIIAAVITVSFTSGEDTQGTDNTIQTTKVFSGGQYLETSKQTSHDVLVLSQC